MEVKPAKREKLDLVVVLKRRRDLKEGEQAIQEELGERAKYKQEEVGKEKKVLMEFFMGQASTQA